jgi:hypothetical protein
VSNAPETSDPGEIKSDPWDRPITRSTPATALRKWVIARYEANRACSTQGSRPVKNIYLPLHQSLTDNFKSRWFVFGKSICQDVDEEGSSALLGSIFGGQSGGRNETPGSENR